MYHQRAVVGDYHKTAFDDVPDLLPVLFDRRTGLPAPDRAETLLLGPEAAKPDQRYLAEGPSENAKVNQVLGRRKVKPKARELDEARGETIDELGTLKLGQVVPSYAIVAVKDTVFDFSKIEAHDRILADFCLSLNLPMHLRWFLNKPWIHPSALTLTSKLVDYEASPLISLYKPGKQPERGFPVPMGSAAVPLLAMRKNDQEKRTLTFTLRPGFADPVAASVERVILLNKKAGFKLSPDSTAPNLTFQHVQELKMDPPLLPESGSLCELHLAVDESTGLFTHQILLAHPEPVFVDLDPSNYSGLVELFEDYHIRLTRSTWLMQIERPDVLGHLFEEVMGRRLWSALDMDTQRNTAAASIQNLTLRGLAGYLPQLWIRGAHRLDDVLTNDFQNFRPGGLTPYAWLVVVQFHVVAHLHPDAIPPEPGTEVPLDTRFISHLVPLTVVCFRLTPKFIQHFTSTPAPKVKQEIDVTNLPHFDPSIRTWLPSFYRWWCRNNALEGQLAGMVPLGFPGLSTDPPPLPQDALGPFDIVQPKAPPPFIRYTLPRPVSQSLRNTDIESWVVWLGEFMMVWSPPIPEPDALPPTKHLLFESKLRELLYSLIPSASVARRAHAHGEIYAFVVLWPKVTLPTLDETQPADTTTKVLRTVLNLLYDTAARRLSPPEWPIPSAHLNYEIETPPLPPQYLDDLRSLMTGNGVKKLFAAQKLRPHPRLLAALGNLCASYLGQVLTDTDAGNVELLVSRLWELATLLDLKLVTFIESAPRPNHVALYEKFNDGTRTWSLLAPLISYAAVTHNITDLPVINNPASTFRIPTTTPWITYNIGTREDLRNHVAIAWLQGRLDVMHVVTPKPVIPFPNEWSNHPSTPPTPPKDVDHFDIFTEPGAPAGSFMTHREDFKLDKTKLRVGDVTRDGSSFDPNIGDANNIPTTVGENELTDNLPLVPSEHHGRMGIFVASSLMSSSLRLPETALLQEGLTSNFMSRHVSFADGYPTSKASLAPELGLEVSVVGFSGSAAYDPLLTLVLAKTLETAHEQWLAKASADANPALGIATEHYDLSALLKEVMASAKKKIGPTNKYNLLHPHTFLPTGHYVSDLATIPQCETLLRFMDLAEHLQVTPTLMVPHPLSQGRYMMVPLRFHRIGVERDDIRDASDTNNALAPFKVDANMMISHIRTHGFTSKLPLPWRGRRTVVEDLKPTEYRSVLIMAVPEGDRVKWVIASGEERNLWRPGTNWAPTGTLPPYLAVREQSIWQFISAQRLATLLGNSALTWDQAGQITQLSRETPRPANWVGAKTPSGFSIKSAIDPNNSYTKGNMRPLDELKAQLETTNYLPWGAFFQNALRQIAFDVHGLMALSQTPNFLHYWVRRARNQARTQKLLPTTITDIRWIADDEFENPQAVEFALNGALISLDAGGESDEEVTLSRGTLMVFQIPDIDGTAISALLRRYDPDFTEANYIQTTLPLMLEDIKQGVAPETLYLKVFEIFDEWVKAAAGGAAITGPEPGLNFPTNFELPRNDWTWNLSRTTLNPNQLRDPDDGPVDSPKPKNQDEQLKKKVAQLFGWKSTNLTMFETLSTLYLSLLPTKNEIRYMLSLIGSGLPVNVELGDSSQERWNDIQTDLDQNKSAWPKIFCLMTAGVTDKTDQLGLAGLCFFLDLHTYTPLQPPNSSPWWELGRTLKHLYTRSDKKPPSKIHGFSKVALAACHLLFYEDSSLETCVGEIVKILSTATGQSHSLKARTTLVVLELISYAMAYSFVSYDVTKPSEGLWGKLDIAVTPDVLEKLLQMISDDMLSEWHRLGGISMASRLLCCFLLMAPYMLARQTVDATRYSRFMKETERLVPGILRREFLGIDFDKHILTISTKAHNAINVVTGTANTTLNDIRPYSHPYEWWPLYLVPMMPWLTPDDKGGEFHDLTSLTRVYSKVAHMPDSASKKGDLFWVHHSILEHLGLYNLMEGDLRRAGSLTAPAQVKMYMQMFARQFGRSQAKAASAKTLPLGPYSPLTSARKEGISPEAYRYLASNMLVAADGHGDPLIDEFGFTIPATPDPRILEKFRELDYGLDKIEDNMKEFVTRAVDGGIAKVPTLTDVGDLVDRAVNTAAGSLVDQITTAKDDMVRDVAGATTALEMAKDTLKTEISGVAAQAALDLDQARLDLGTNITAIGANAAREITAANTLLTATGATLQTNLNNATDTLKTELNTEIAKVAEALETRLDDAANSVVTATTYLKDELDKSVGNIDAATKDLKLDFESFKKALVESQAKVEKRLHEAEGRLFGTRANLVELQGTHRELSTNILKILPTFTEAVNAYKTESSKLSRDITRQIKDLQESIMSYREEVPVSGLTTINERLQELRDDQKEVQHALFAQELVRFTLPAMIAIDEHAKDMSTGFHHVVSPDKGVVTKNLFDLSDATATRLANIRAAITALYNLLQDMGKQEIAELSMGVEGIVGDFQEAVQATLSDFGQQAEIIRKLLKWWLGLTNGRITRAQWSSWIGTEDSPALKISETFETFIDSLQNLTELDSNTYKIEDGDGVQLDIGDLQVFEEWFTEHLASLNEQARIFQLYRAPVQKLNDGDLTAIRTLVKKQGESLRDEIKAEMKQVKDLTVAQTRASIAQAEVIEGLDTKLEASEQKRARELKDFSSNISSKVQESLAAVQKSLAKDLLNSKVEIETIQEVLTNLLISLGHTKAQALEFQTENSPNLTPGTVLQDLMDQQAKLRLDIERSQQTTVNETTRLFNERLGRVEKIFAEKLPVTQQLVDRVKDLSSQVTTTITQISALEKKMADLSAAAASKSPSEQGQQALAAEALVTRTQFDQAMERMANLTTELGDVKRMISGLHEEVYVFGMIKDLLANIRSSIELEISVRGIDSMLADINKNLRENVRPAFEAVYRGNVVEFASRLLEASLISRPSLVRKILYRIYREEVAAKDAKQRLAFTIYKATDSDLYKKYLTGCQSARKIMIADMYAGRDTSLAQLITRNRDPSSAPFATPRLVKMSNVFFTYQLAAALRSATQDRIPDVPRDISNFSMGQWALNTLSIVLSSDRDKLVSDARTHLSQVAASYDDHTFSLPPQMFASNGSPSPLSSAWIQVGALVKTTLQQLIDLFAQNVEVTSAKPQIVASWNADALGQIISGMQMPVISQEEDSGLLPPSWMINLFTCYLFVIHSSILYDRVAKPSQMTLSEWLQWPPFKKMINSVAMLDEGPVIKNILEEALTGPDQSVIPDPWGFYLLDFLDAEKVRCTIDSDDLVLACWSPPDVFDDGKFVRDVLTRIQSRRGDGPTFDRAFLAITETAPVINQRLPSIVAAFERQGYPIEVIVCDRTGQKLEITRNNGLLPEQFVRGFIV